MVINARSQPLSLDWIILVKLEPKTEYQNSIYTIYTI